MMFTKAVVINRDDNGDPQTYSTTIVGYVCDNYGQVKAVCLKSSELHAVHLDELSEVVLHVD